MKALTLTRPWEIAILDLDKDIENRTWTTGYRGPLLIHGGRDARPRDVELVYNHALDAGWPADPDVLDYWLAQSVPGFVGVVDLVDVCMRERQRITLPAKGQLGLWTPTPAVLEEIKCALS